MALIRPRRDAACMAQNPKKIFGQVLRRAREGLGISQEELSARSGVSVDSISRAERAIALPGWEAVLELSKALGITPTHFAPGAVTDAARLREAQAELASLTMAMSITEIQKLIEQARLVVGRKR